MRFCRVGRASAAVLAVLAIAAMTASAANASSATNTITVNGKEYSFSVSGPLRPGVATIKFHDAGTSWHQMVMFRVKPGVTLDQVKAAVLSSDPNAGAQISADPDTTNYGEPGFLSPGKTVTTIVPDLVAGTYAIACFFPASDGLPHAAHGMIAMLTVKGKKYTTLPTTDGTIQLTDTGIVASKKLKSTGTHTFKVENNSAMPRDLTIGKPNTGTTFDQLTTQVRDALQNNKPTTDVPGAVVASIDGLSAGQASYVVVNLAKGSYGYISSVQSNNGPPPPGSALKDTFTVK